MWAISVSFNKLPEVKKISRLANLDTLAQAAVFAESPHNTTRTGSAISVTGALINK
jgi:hypothetical protein